MTAADFQSLQAAAQAGDAAAQFAYAQALGAQGQRDEALTWLRRSAQGGYPFAQAMLGARLVAKESTPESWREGVDFIRAAHQAGVADATNMLAVLIAMGAATPESWADALDLVQLAAERGSNRGRTQLAALGREYGAAMAAQAGDWAAMRAAITLDSWFAAPEPEMLSTSPTILVFRNFISPALCAWMIDRARGRVARALVFDTATGQGRVEPDRNNSAFEFNVIEADLIIALTRARIAAAIGAEPARMETPQVLNYQVGETFAPHFDFLDVTLPGLALDVAKRGQRSLTFLIYLNDDFDGGETDFPNIGVKFRGRAGDAMLFHNLDPSGAPDRRTRHAGLPPTRGEKWLFSQWIRDRAPTWTT